jgi:regulator of sigma D
MDCYDRILEIANGHSDKRVSKIFKLRYVDGKQNKLMPWKDISKKMNLSIQGCINIHNAAIKYIRKVLEKEIDYVK